MGSLVLSPKGLAWFRKGHPWVYRTDLERIKDAASGSVVAMESKNGKFLAQGFYSEHSKISFRVVSRSREPIDAQFWERRVLDAFRYRQAVVQQSNAYRLIYGESDGIPSLVLDRYADHFVLQALTLATENLLPVFVEIILKVFQPASIILRNDVMVRDLEGLPQEKKILFGQCPKEVQVFEGEIHYLADLWTGQKTGAYLDQRENRLLGARFLRETILDAFCYQGLFGLHAARRSSRVIGIDSSQEAVDRANENAALNGLSNTEFSRENVFDFLKTAVEEKRQFDGIILDPPPFAKSRENVAGASRGYKELNLRAMRLLTPGGILITSSCSYNMSESTFLDILRDCAKDSGSTWRIIERRGQSADHPVLLSFPESFYLKCLFLQKIE
jgi:23S rRNA (cytosine1962-C5)-methyltransferase